jgi:hypothetical protein
MLMNRKLFDWNSKETPWLGNTQFSDIDPRLAAICVVIVAALTTFFRFNGITENGVIGSDTFQYWNIAWMWNQSQFVLNDSTNEPDLYFRPLFYFLNMMSLRIFGPNDYSLRALIGIFETANVFLVFLLTRIYFRNWLLSTTTSICYALTGTVLISAMRELTHTYTVTFVLLMLIFLILALDETRPAKRRWFFVASGISLGSAFIIHGTAAFWGPSIVFFLILMKHKNYLHKAAEITAFGCGTVLPIFISAGLIGFGTAYQALLFEINIRAETNLSPLTLFLKWLEYGPKESFSTLTSVGFWICVVVALTNWLRQKINIRWIMPTILFLTYIFCYSFVFKNVYLNRLFLPLNILVLLTVFSTTAFLLCRLTVRKQIMGLLTVATLITGTSIAGNLDLLMSYYNGKQKGPVRAVFDQLGSRTSPDSKVLVAPSVYPLGKRHFDMPLYFKNRSVYLVDCHSEPIESYLNGSQVKYVYIANESIWSLKHVDHPFFTHIGGCFKSRLQPYDPYRERQLLVDFLNNHKGVKRLVGIESEYGEIYELTDPNW